MEVLYLITLIVFIYIHLLHLLNVRFFLIDTRVIIDARRIAGVSKDSDYIPKDPREFAK